MSCSLHLGICAVRTECSSSQLLRTELQPLTWLRCTGLDTPLMSCLRPYGPTSCAKFILSFMAFSYSDEIDLHRSQTLRSRSLITAQQFIPSSEIQSHSVTPRARVFVRTKRTTTCRKRAMPRSIEFGFQVSPDTSREERLRNDLFSK